MPYVGRDLQRGNYLKLDDISSSFNGSTTTFNLTSGGNAFFPGSAFSIIVSLGGVVQEPESAFQIDRSQIIFATAPTASSDFFCIALGVALGVGVPGHNTVGNDHLAKPLSYGDYFRWDSANNRVGINTLLPSVALDVVGDATFSGNVSIGATLTYDDVANIDSVGLITARAGIKDQTLTAGRVVYTGTGGRLVDNSNLTYSGTSIGVPQIIVGSALTANSTGIHVSGVSTFRDEVQIRSGNQIKLSNNANSANATIDCDGGARLHLKSYNQSVATFEEGVGTIFYQSSGTARLTITPTGGVEVGAAGTIKIPEKIMHSGDEDTFMKFDTNTISFDTAGSERLRIQSDGKVGIGTDSITANLHLRTTGANATLFMLETDMSDSVQNRSFYIQSPESVSTDLPFRIRTANSMLFMTDANKALMIQHNGYVGINTTNPLSGLHVSDGTAYGAPQNANREATLTISAGSEASADIQLLSANYNHIFFGDSADPNTGMIHYEHTGSNVDNLVFSTAGGERLRITSTGKVLIGHDTPTEIGVGAGYQMPLQVIGTSYDTSGMVLARYENNENGPTLAFVKSRNATKGAQTIVQANDNLGMIRFLGSDGTDTQNAAARIRAFCDTTPASNKIPGRIVFETTSTLTYAQERMRIDSAGRVVIGGEQGNAGASGLYVGGAALAVLGTGYTPNTYACFAMGRVGANVTANTTITNIRLNGGTLGTGRGAEINAAADANWSDGSSHPTRLTFHTVASSSTSATERLRITNAGSVNIGGDYAQTTYTMKVTGSFAATTKSFVIDHPTKEKHKLRYACLEGPENSVYVRGKTSDSVIELPDYWIGLVHEDSITVNVTPIGNHKVWVESINNNSVTIGSDGSEYFYTVFAERKDVDKLEVEVAD